ncbi:MAG: U32 family peptidase [Cellulosilyticum sp.]|nr:U32 family peptidase [Cellulosilyticum sp.]
MKKAELLAPVGKMENAIAAIENGADALFVGGKGFNARQAADNFTEDELEEIVKYATLRGVRVYVTVNILIKESETENLYEYLKYLEAIGVHAIIIQDLGIAHMVRKYFPKLRMHASTQMSAHSIEDVLFLKELGFKRVVLAREMQLKEIKEIIDTCDIEIETFVHGALCYSYSGQCLMSSFIGGRSGNRGRCAQTCRMRYSLKEDGKVLNKEDYLLSLKDICSIEFIPELLEAGIHSFKIEGRMKSPEYVASVVGTYRKYVDIAEKGEDYKVTDEDLNILKGIFNRGGFSKGYYYNKGNRKMLTPMSPRHIGLKVGEVVRFVAKTGQATIQLTHTLNPGDGLEIIRKGKDSVGTGITKVCEAGSRITCQFDKYVEVGSEVYLTKNHQLLKQMRQTYVKPVRKMPITMKIIGRIGDPLEIEMTGQGKTIVFTGGLLEVASQNPITKEQARKQLTKLGSTSFVARQVEIEWPEDAYIGISQLNEVRRGAALKLEEALLEKETDQVPEVYEREAKASYEGRRWAAHVTTLEQLDIVLGYPKVDIIYWEWMYQNDEAMEALVRCQKAGKAFYLALPNIMKDDFYRTYYQDLWTWRETALKGFLIRNMGEYHFLREMGKELVVDYNMNVANNETIGLWDEQGISRITTSMELSVKEEALLKGHIEKVIYGYFPVMTSSQCVLRGTPSCQKGVKDKHHFELEDRKQMPWRVQTDCKACVMQLMSYEPLMLRKSELPQNAVLRIQLTNETGEKTKVVMESYFGQVEVQGLKGAMFKNVL